MRNRHRFAVLHVLTALLIGTRLNAADPVEGRDSVNAVLWMQNSAEYRHATRQAYRLARLQLDRALMDKSISADLVQLQEGGFADKPPAIILDVDETVLDNSIYTARLIRGNERRRLENNKRRCRHETLLNSVTFTSKSWYEWTQEEQAGLIPGAGEFIRDASGRGVRVFYVTNRRDPERAATVRNLRKFNLPADEDTVQTRNDKEGRGKDKMTRRAMVARNYRILLLIGDNTGDFRGGLDSSDQTKRNEVARKGEQIAGDSWIVIPNPAYGGWEDPLRSLPSKLDGLTTDRAAE